MLWWVTWVITALGSGIRILGTVVLPPSKDTLESIERA
jgi:hypothetical protein